MRIRHPPGRRGLHGLGTHDKQSLRLTMDLQDRKERFQIDAVHREMGEVWQGDVLLRFHGDEQQLSIVVSADCDLVHSKGEMLCIPLHSIHTYLEQAVYYDALESALSLKSKTYGG